MTRIPSLTWEYGPKTREILAARELQAFLDTEIDPEHPEHYEDVALSLLSDRGQEGGEPEMPRHTYGPGRPRPTQPKPTKAKKPSQKGFGSGVVRRWL